MCGLNSINRKFMPGLVKGGAQSVIVAGQSRTTLKLFGVNKKATMSKISRKSPMSSVVTVPETMEEHMTYVTDRVQKVKKLIAKNLQEDGFSIVDGFLGSALCEHYRSEAQGIYNRGEMSVSQSTRYDKESDSVVTYDKVNVQATQLNGGAAYELSPRLHEYIVAMIRSLVPDLSVEFPEAMLSSTMASNKLAVCLGDGSLYDKHYDNSGYDDLRKLTVLLYLNPLWREELGGQFRLYLPKHCVDTSSKEHSKDSDGFYYKDIEPINDRLLVFWSDRIVHSVQPSQVFSGESDHRYAMTVWIATEDSRAIIQDDQEVLQHFNNYEQRVFTP